MSVKPWLNEDYRALQSRFQDIHRRAQQAESREAKLRRQLRALARHASFAASFALDTGDSEASPPSPKGSVPPVETEQP